MDCTQEKIDKLINDAQRDGFVSLSESIQFHILVAIMTNLERIADALENRRRSDDAGP